MIAKSSASKTASHQEFGKRLSYVIARLNKMPKVRAQKIGVRFLSRLWCEEAKKRKYKTNLPLPSFKERLFGGQLSPSEIAEARTQTLFLLSLFKDHISHKAFPALRERMLSNIPKKHQSLNTIIDYELSKKDVLEEIASLSEYLKNNGHIYFGESDSKGKISLSKGWFDSKLGKSVPLHEGIHALKAFGIIKRDAPFAYAFDYLYLLERRIVNLKKSMGFPKNNEFNRVPLRKPALNEFTVEPDWSKSAGQKLAQWVYAKLPKEKRWVYLRERCMGRTHLQALKIIEPVVR